jgi:phenylacetic acid degradation operon negative regulatory protein
VHARSALFDVYGDHLLGRGGVAPVASLIRMLAPLGVQPPAVRTAVSRMVGQGWLERAETDTGAGYALTPRAAARLRQAGDRIYRRAVRAWDGQWHVHVLDPIRDRGRRERVRNQLRFLGLAPLSDSTWVGAHPNAEVDQLLTAEGLTSVHLTTEHIAPGARLLEAFAVADLGRQYDAWLASARRLVEPVTEGDGDQACFAARSELVHEWRKFLFADPMLPSSLLPADWSGEVAAAYFTEHAGRLLPAATRFVDACLATEPAGHLAPHHARHRSPDRSLDRAGAAR